MHPASRSRGVAGPCPFVTTAEARRGSVPPQLCSSAREEHWTALIANLLPLLCILLPHLEEVRRGRAHEFELWGCFPSPCALPLQLQSPVFMMASLWASHSMSAGGLPSASANSQSRVGWTAGFPRCPAPLCYPGRVSDSLSPTAAGEVWHTQNTHR